MQLIGKRGAMRRLLACTLCLGTLALGGGAMADGEDPAIDSLIDTAAGELMQQHGIPGLAIAVTAHGTQRFYSYGVTSRETRQPVSRDTLFEIGSISKTFTATLAAYAQANGKLSLGESPSQYLPRLRGSALDQVTLINLATHTAGGFPLQVPEAIGNTEQLMDYFSAWQPDYAPGTHRTYANPSIGLLGMVAARSLNLPFEEALEQQLFPALGLSSSYIEIPTSKRSLYAQGYTKEDVPARLSPGVLAAQAYGVKTSARDLIRFVDANLGLIPLTPQLQRAIEATHTGYFQSGAMTQALVWEQYDYPVTLDVLLEGNSSTMAYERNLATALNPPRAPQRNLWINKTGSTNGFGAYAAFIPAKRIGIVVLANRNYPIESRVRLAQRILAALACCSPHR